MIPFIDVSSNNQGFGIDWPAVAHYLTTIHPEAGVIVKAMEGIRYANPVFHEQRMGAHAAGIRNVGLYDFNRPSEASGSQEAEYLLSAIGKDGGILTREFLCGDFEDTRVSPSADLDAYVLDWTSTLTRALGISVVGYTGEWYALPHNLTRDPRLAELGLWWCDPGETLPETPEPWRSAGKQILFWQHSWQGRIPGIPTPVDLDWLVGPIETLRPYQWGLQPDPVAGKPATGTPDVSGDVPTILKHCLQILRSPSPDLATLYADIAKAETQYGLQGA